MTFIMVLYLYRLMIITLSQTHYLFYPSSHPLTLIVTPYFVNSIFNEIILHLIFCPSPAIILFDRCYTIFCPQINFFACNYCRTLSSCTVIVFLVLQILSCFDTCFCVYVSMHVLIVTLHYTSIKEQKMIVTTKFHD